MNNNSKIKVLIVDDSVLVRDILQNGLSKDPLIEVVGTAPDPYIARDKIVFKKPDVIILDVKMPRMSGIDFLKKLIPQYPIPVIMVSAVTAPGAETTLDALEFGAVDFVLKPSGNSGHKLSDMMDELIRKIKIAARVNPDNLNQKIKNVKSFSHDATLDKMRDLVIGIGASTGGTTAITKIVNAFPPNMPGTVIVQHMPPNFTRMFADKLNETAKVNVKEAVDGERIIAGHIFIAPGGFHMKVNGSRGEYFLKCYKGKKVNRHCPSVEVLFDSIAKNVGKNAIGVMLTGMGSDGAKGMLAMRERGARTIAQDEKSCIVFGMPNEAFKLGGVEKLVSLDNITSTLLKLLKEKKNAL